MLFCLLLYPGYVLIWSNFCIILLEQIGPNVSISANARVGPGVRLISCIILDDVEIKVVNQIKGDESSQLVH